MAEISEGELRHRLAQLGGVRVKHSHAQPDPRELEAREKVRNFFEGHPDEVFYSRQVEISFEDPYYHWITNRAIRNLIGERVISSETRQLASGGEVHLLWLKKFRYYRRAASSLVELLNRYSDSNITAAVGLHGEAMVLEAFARNEFVMRGRDVRSFRGRTWEASGHNLDFVFERDNRCYGVEVKNKLGYMDKTEFDIKTLMCQWLGLIPVFVVRMVPRAWVQELYRQGGFVLILGWQLYPWTHKTLAQEVHKRTGLPVDAPRRLEDGTMQRFLDFHLKNV